MTWLDPSGLALVIVLVVLAVGGFVQAVTGFGFALFSVPLLSFVIGPTQAVLVAIVIGLAMAIGVVARERAHLAWRDLTVLVVAGLLGLPLGLWVLTVLEARALTVLVAVVLLGSTFAVWRGATVPSGPVSRAAAGFTSGALLVSTSFNGPPLVLYLHGRGLAPRTTRATLSACFLVQSAVAVAMVFGTGVATSQTAMLSLVGLPALAVGWLLGNRVFARMNPERFRRGVLAMLTLTGVVSLARAVLG